VISATYQAACRPQSQRLSHIAASPNATIEQDVAATLDGIDNLAEH
jgi:hypothetical protein